MNFTENILAGRENGLAIINMNEGNLSNPEQLSWKNLRETVRQYADSLKSSGVRKGDVVARRKWPLTYVCMCYC